jgi:hypothetical protein
MELGTCSLLEQILSHDSLESLHWQVSYHKTYDDIKEFKSYFLFAGAFLERGAVALV